MQFSESEQLIDDMLQWANLSEPTKPKRDLEEVISFSVSTAAHSDRDSLQTRTELFEAYQEAMRKEDYALSLDLMQRFFDYETHPLAGGSSANRGVRQHALLNLAQFHYIHEEYAAAKLAANEGMKIARHASDLIALNALTSLVKKLTFEDSSDRLEYRDGAHADAPSIETSREDPGGYVPPADYVWDVRYGLSTVRD